MNYYTLKLHTPNQTLLIPVGSTVLEVIPPGTLSDRDSLEFNDAACPSILVGADPDTTSEELNPIYISCTPVNHETRWSAKYNNDKCFDTGQVEDNSFGVPYAESKTMAYLGKFKITRSGQEITYLVTCESSPSANALAVGIAAVVGDSSAGVAEGTLPRAVI